jgi:hypothetical protein
LRARRALQRQKEQRRRVRRVQREPLELERLEQEPELRDLAPLRRALVLPKGSVRRREWKEWA